MKIPTSSPSNVNGTTKAYVNGSPEDVISNTGGSKGAKIIGNAKDSSAGKLKTYKMSVSSLNTGEINQRGTATNLLDRDDL